MNKPKKSDELGTMTRRKMLLGATALTATLASGKAFASSDHANHHMASADKGLIDAALGCVKAGNTCVDHCIELVKNNDTSIGDCLDAVTSMLPMCTTLSKLAANQSRHLAAFAKVCIEVCEDCRQECKRHADKHPECKACMESCETCIKECKKVAA